MIIFLSILLQLSFAESIVPPKTIPAGAETFECGTYWLSGKLTTTENFKTFLDLYPTTTRHFHITLSKLKPKLAIVLAESIIRAKVEVTKAGKGNEAHFVVLDKPTRITKTQALSEPILKISSKDCKK